MCSDCTRPVGSSALQEPSTTAHEGGDNFGAQVEGGSVRENYELGDPMMPSSSGERLNLFGAVTGTFHAEHL